MIAVTRKRTLALLVEGGCLDLPLPHDPPRSRFPAALGLALVAGALLAAGLLR